VADFRLVVRGGRLLNRSQDEAIQKLGAESGGPLSVEQRGEGAVLIIAPGGQKFICFSDGRLDRRI
jgi:hypothetical protein